MVKGYSIYTDAELFSFIAKDDENAFTELFYRYTPKLLPFINKLTRNEHLSTEMIQETFLRVWVRRAELEQVKNPGGWIYRIASNISIEYLRNTANRKRILQSLPVAEQKENIADIVESKQLELIIRKAVHLLPEKRQEVYRLSREEGLSHQEIADKLNISTNTVKNQIGSAMKFIHEYINRETGLSIVTLLILLGK